MHFIDEVKIYVRSGSGGAGSVSFRREKFIPRGGPDGGNGGRGGSVIIRAIESLNTLIDYRYKQHFKVARGMHGMGRQRDGKASEDIILNVPVGTQIFLEDGETLFADLTHVGQEILVAKGGKGGTGNMYFKSSTNQAPRYATPGQEGEERWLWMRLKLLSDAGLVGMPNAGKSTFLAATTSAKPKIADYPFTTLKPQLGVVYVGDTEFVLADIPGLIAGAHEGIGLGTRFLKHIERCGVLLHLVDGTQEDVATPYRIVREELEQHNPELAEKPEIVALSKADCLQEEDVAFRVGVLRDLSGKEPFVISAASGHGLDGVKYALLEAIKASRAEAVTIDQAPSAYTAQVEDYDSTIQP